MEKIETASYFQLPRFRDADEAFRALSVNLLSRGRAEAHPDTSVIECGNVGFSIENGRSRIANSAARFDIVGAVARFVWMLRGANDVDSIAFYSPGVRRFGVDGRILGSSYGDRLRGTRTGTDQIGGVIDRLRAIPDTRQAAAVIWEPEDATRHPFDIPCAIACTFRVTNDRLISTTLMRSNKIVTLLPFNLFEFTLQAEYIAATLDVELGEYTHFISVAQMPLQDRREAERLEELSAAHVETMAPMPSIPQPQRQFDLLVEADRLIRDARDYDHAQDRLASLDELCDWWRELALVLAGRWLFLNRDWPRLEQLSESLSPAIGNALRSQLAVKQRSQAKDITHGD